MNQEQNNLNQSNFNPQGNNGIPNNQPLNDQSLNNTFDQNVAQNSNVNVSSATVNQQVSPTPSYEQPIIQDINSQPINNSLDGRNANNQNSNNNSKKMKLGLIIGIAVVIVIVGIALVLKLFGKYNKTLTNENSNVIIVENKDKKSALFNVKGKQLTEFYDEITEFHNDIAIVKNNKEYAVINSKGKFIINFKEYKYITTVGFIIRARDDKYNYNLIDNKGKKIKKIIDEEIQEYWDYDKLIIIEDDEYYEILNSYTGSLIKKIKRVNEEDDLEVYDGEYDLTYFYYNNKTYIINYKTGEIINELTGEKEVNSINSINNSQYVIFENGNKTFDYYNNDKKVFTTKKCANLFFEEDNNNLICRLNGKEYLIDNKGKKTLEIYNSDSDYDIAYLDSKNYIINKNNSTIFYVGGKKRKEIKDTVDVNVTSRSNKIYKLKTKTGKYQLYNFKGKLISNQYFTYISSYDKTNLAIVSSNKKDFLIDIKGNKVSKDYDNILFDNSLYVAKKNNIYYILDAKGKEIMQKKATSNNITVHDNFFTISDKKKLVYYTLNGKEFYTKNY